MVYKLSRIGVAGPLASAVLRPAGAERSLPGAEEVDEHAEVVVVRHW